jgi:polyphosphate kinase 2 (PPK2 family)
MGASRIWESEPSLTAAQLHRIKAPVLVVDDDHDERMLVESGITMVKLWPDISKKEQAERLDARQADPLNVLKVSDLDSVAQKKWREYSAARDTMLARTDTPLSPWHCVRADHKKPARVAP